MNNARGRWPRPPPNRNLGNSRGPPTRNANGNVPNIQQVIPGAAVSIVLKEDQATGREVQGQVKDLLTNGNHPRGIKVRLQDGQIGRVQRMGGGTTAAAAAPPSIASIATPSALAPRTVQPARGLQQDYRYDGYEDGPPPRSLADYVPEFVVKQPKGKRGKAAQPAPASIVAKCPICGDFEGDEIAVSRHVEEHVG